MSRLLALAFFGLCVACGSEGNAPGSSTSSSASPGEIGNVNCSTESGSANGWTEFGATIGAWNASHERDPNYLEWGPKLGDGRRMYPIVRCSNDGRVIALERHIYPPVTAAGALAAAKGELPADVKVVYDVTQAECRIVQYQSATLASEMGNDNPDGIADIQLESPIISGLTYDPASIGTARIDLFDPLGVKPDGCELPNF